MSAEGKKKRGISGVANAKANPFRYNGWPTDWQARRLGCFHMQGAASSGSTTMRGMLGGVLAQRLGFGAMHGSRYELMLEHAQRRCSHELFKDNEPRQQAAE